MSELRAKRNKKSMEQLNLTSFEDAIMDSS